MLERKCELQLNTNHRIRLPITSKQQFYFTFLNHHLVRYYQITYDYTVIVVYIINNTLVFGCMLYQKQKT